LTTVFNLMNLPNLPMLENFTICGLVDLCGCLTRCLTGSRSPSVLSSPVFPEISYAESGRFEYLFGRDSGAFRY
jgi:hypothetical protein